MSDNEVQEAWDTNAENWDTNMGEGNSFALRLVVPAEQRLLTVKPGDRILDAACGNGLHSRRLARLGAKVTAFDISPRLIEFARARSPGELDIEYRVIDGTDASAMDTLPSEFDAIVCHMAVFDMERVDALFSMAASRLRPGAPFVVSSTHPCFNGPAPVLFMEVSDDFASVNYGVKVERYATPARVMRKAFTSAPVPHPLFHRPFSVILGHAFEAGLVVTGFEEPVFDTPPGSSSAPLSWDSRVKEIPPVVVYRFERAAH